jgi:hypothetical protein
MKRKPPVPSVSHASRESRHSFGGVGTIASLPVPPSRGEGQGSKFSCFSSPPHPSGFLRLRHLVQQLLVEDWGLRCCGRNHDEIRLSTDSPDSSDTLVTFRHSSQIRHSFRHKVLHDCSRLLVTHKMSREHALPIFQKSFRRSSLPRDPQTFFDEAPPEC